MLGDEATSDEGCGREPWELCDGDGLLGPPRNRALLGDAVSGKTSIVVFVVFKNKRSTAMCQRGGQNSRAKVKRDA